MIWTAAHVELFDVDQTVREKNNLYLACQEHWYVRRLLALASEEFARILWLTLSGDACSMSWRMGNLMS